MREVFDSLVHGLAESLKMPPSELLVGGSMQVDGVNFRLLLHESMVEAVVILLCRFGRVSEADNLALCRLLQTNLQLVDGEMSSFFAMDELNHDVVFCVRTMLLDTTVEDLLGCIQVCTTEAKIWSEKHYSRAVPSPDLMP